MAHPLSNHPNPAYRILNAIGLGNLCGVWEKTKRYKGPTRAKTVQRPHYSVADALREWNTSKNLAAMKVRRIRAQRK